MIGIVDYGLGNVLAFMNIYRRLNIPVKVVKTPGDFIEVTKLILPGVGSFDYAMQRLNESGMRQSIEKLVFKKKMPILGVCVGMQMLAVSSEEGEFPGLGWINGRVKKMNVQGDLYSPYLPHMGWNGVIPKNNENLFNGLSKESKFYFLHSYHFECLDSVNIAAVTEYGGKFTSAVRQGNIFGVQFHPEKSHDFGVKLLENFSRVSYA